ncbi:MAG: hypothetical protein LOD85_10095, partial [Clostridia bacterium]
MAKRTETSAFGVSKRESHDASRFYSRSLYQDGGLPLFGRAAASVRGKMPARSVGPRPEEE